MRYGLSLLLLLAACHRVASDGAPKVDAKGHPLPVIACTIAGVAGKCSVERVAAPGGLILLVRHSDGGFRRLAIAGGGRGVVTADGALPARVSVVSPGMIEVAVADDRYRLPATVGR